MRLILIRHAETDGNKTHYVGRQDLPLNTAGRLQAAALAHALAAEPIDCILAGPLIRARDTAAAIADPRGLAVDIRDGLIEVDYGELQGTLKGEKPFKLRKRHLHQPMPGGESLADVWGRLGAVAGTLRQQLALGRTIVVVGHYWSNRLLLSLMSGVEFEDAVARGAIKPANASAYALDFRPADGALRPAEPLLLFTPGKS